MFTRTIFRGVVLALLTLLVFVSVAEGAVCKPSPAKSATASTSSGETGATSLPFHESRNDSCPSSTQDSGDHLCMLCPSCLSHFIGDTPVSVFRDDHFQRFALPEFSTLYEAPSFSHLRPPIL